MKSYRSRITPAQAVLGFAGSFGMSLARQWKNASDKEKATFPQWVKDVTGWKDPAKKTAEAADATAAAATPPAPAAAEQPTTPAEAKPITDPAVVEEKPLDTPAAKVDMNDMEAGWNDGGQTAAVAPPQADLQQEVW